MMWQTVKGIIAASIAFTVYLANIIDPDGRNGSWRLAGTQHLYGLLRLNHSVCRWADICREMATAE